jgi:uncharacterized protein
MSTAISKPRARLHTDGTITFDGFANFLSGLGAGNPKTAANSYVLECSQVDLEVAYRSSTWFGKIVDIPADDGTREWRAWQAEKDQIEVLEAEEHRLMLRPKLRQAMIWSRLYGGAVIIPGGLPGKPDQPLVPERIGKNSIRYLTVLHRWDIQAHGMIRDPLSEFYGQPEYYALNTEGGVEVRLHPSRVIRINGREVPNRMGGDHGWGDSVWVHLHDAITSSDAGAAVIGALMQEAKIDVVRVPEMMVGMATAEYEAAMLRRFRMAAMLKSISNVLLLDKDDEWNQKQITWAGIPDVMNTLLTIMAGAADIPVTRLIGTSAKGLNATGEGDLKNYYDTVKAKQELVLSPALKPLDEMLIRSALGSRPPKVWYNWNSLWQPTDKEQAEVDKLEAETTLIYVNTGLIPSDALAKSVQNRMIESERWPGIEQALDEATEELDVPDPDGDDADVTVPQGQRATVAADAAPRTLYVRRDVINRADIVRWAEAQGFTDIVPDLHVTIAYSTTPVDWFAVGTSWSEKIEIAAGGPRQMERLGPDGEYIALLITANELVWRNKEIREAGASWSWPDYQPHISIQVGGDMPDGVKPYQGKIVLGPEMFEEIRET